jgi:hypothetical protein
MCDTPRIFRTLALGIGARQLSTGSVLLLAYTSWIMLRKASMYPLADARLF